jgi:hypothetical protein
MRCRVVSHDVTYRTLRANGKTTWSNKMRRIAIVFVLLLMYAPSLAAQRRIPGMRTAESATWVTAGIGFFTGNGVNDGVTESTWDFGSSTNFQYRGSLERSMGSQSSFGIVGSYVRVPFIYTSAALVPPPESCTRCEAHLDMMTLSASFHSGGGLGFHQVIEGNAGMAWYRNLKRDSDGGALAPTGGNLDPIFSFGYGFGYGLSQNTQINLVQDYGIALHEKKGLANGVSNTNTVRALRFTARFGFGSRVRTR